MADPRRKHIGITGIGQTSRGPEAETPEPRHMEFPNPRDPADEDIAVFIAAVLGDAPESEKRDETSDEDRAEGCLALRLAQPA